MVLITTWGGTEFAWGSVQITGLGAAAVVSLAAFVVVERAAAEPVLPLHIFRNRNFSIISVIGFLVGFVMFGAVTFLPLYQQTVQGASATNSGLLLLPMLLAMLVVSLFSGRMTTKTGKYKVYPIVGGALITFGALLLSQLDTGTDRFTSGLMMAVLGAGMGFLMQITMLVAQNSVEMKDMGVASSTSTLFRTIGGSFGVSLFGAIFAHRVTGSMEGSLGDQGGSVASGNGQIDPSRLEQLPEQVRDAYLHAVASGTGSVFLWGAIISVVGFVAAWFVKEVPLRGAGPQPDDAEGEGRDPRDSAPAVHAEA